VGVQAVAARSDCVRHRSGIGIAAVVVAATVQAGVQVKRGGRKVGGRLGHKEIERVVGLDCADAGVVQGATAEERHGE